MHYAENALHGNIFSQTFCQKWSSYEGPRQLTQRLIGALKTSSLNDQERVVNSNENEFSNMNIKELRKNKVCFILK